MRVVVSDTSPICYLILIGAEDLLEQLYGRVMIPAAVVKELQAEGTPQAVRSWIQSPPSWIEILSSNHDLSILQNPQILGVGESEAILLALSVSADLVLMDDRTSV